MRKLIVILLTLSVITSYGQRIIAKPGIILDTTVTLSNNSYRSVFYWDGTCQFLAADSTTQDSLGTHIIAGYASAVKSNFQMVLHETRYAAGDTLHYTIVAVDLAGDIQTPLLNFLNSTILKNKTIKVLKPVYKSKLH